MYAREVSDAAQRTAAELRLEVADAKARAKRAGVELRQESQEVAKSCFTVSLLVSWLFVCLCKFPPFQLIRLEAFN